MNHYHLIEKYNTVTVLGELYGMIVIGAHIFATFFLIIAKHEDYSWLDKYEIKEADI